MLAVLLGVNIGPNLTYTGSLATLLWRRVLHEHGAAPARGIHQARGCSPYPRRARVLALWAGLHILGG